MPVEINVAVVALDGPAGAGKSTVGLAVARALGFAFVETGKLYRAVGLKALRERAALDDAAALAALCGRTVVSYRLDADGPHVLVDGKDVTASLATPEVAEAASAVSSRPEVRAALLPVQRALATAPGVVMEGRDIGTVVFPRARYKFFLDGSPAERARRRCRDFAVLGLPADEADVQRDLEARDRRDAQRAAAPLVKAADAIYVDTSDVAFDDVVRFIVSRVRAGQEGKG